MMGGIPIVELDEISKSVQMLKNMTEKYTESAEQLSSVV
jgi:hypothetical protein